MAGKGSSRGRKAAPSSFMYYVVSVLGLSTLLAVIGLLMVNFWVTRPVNLSAETDRLADALEASMTDNYIPPQNIVREPATAESVVRDRAEMRWTAHDFTLTLPPHIKSSVLKDELRKDMSVYFAKLVDQERDMETGCERFSLYLDELPFATVSLAPAPAEVATPYRSDLRSGSQQLADLLESELSLLGVAPPPLREAAVEQQDLNTLWLYTHFTAQLPPGVTLGDLKGRLEARNTLPDAVFNSDVQHDPPVDLLVSLSGKLCVGLACTGIAAVADPQRPAPVFLDDVLNDGILGSEPDESADSPPEQGAGLIAGALVGVEPVEALQSEKALEPLETPAMKIPDEPVDAAKPAEPVKMAKNVPAPRNGIIPPATVRMAILIDDGGYNSAHGDRILALDSRLTLAILPNTPFGAEIAERGAQKGFEIMLHMPMETDSETLPSVPGTVYTKMGKEEIQKLTNEAIDQIPYIAGINNHTGSKFTSDRTKMEYVLEVLKGRGLYFIDSVTTNTTVAFETAREMGIPSGRRDVFLDDSTDEASVRRQFKLLVEAAVQEGSAIGIGHFQTPATARVLAEEIPKLAEAGIELVHASELVQ